MPADSRGIIANRQNAAAVPGQAGIYLMAAVVDDNNPAVPSCPAATAGCS
jgi:hypothetical protein